MKRFWFAAAAAWGFLAAGVGAQPPDLSRLDIVERSVPDGPVAIVDGSPVTKEDFLNLYRRELTEMSMMRGGGAISDRDRVMTGLRCLYGLVQQELLHQEAVRRGFNVTSQQVDAAIAEEIARLEQVLSHADGSPLRPGELTTEQVLAEMGRSMDEVRRDMRRMLMIEQVYDALTREKNPTVTDQEIREFYQGNPEMFRRAETMTVKQIFLSPKPNPREASARHWEELESRMERALARIRAGESFDAVARDVSERPEQVTLADVPVENLPPFFVERADRMQPGDISGVFRSEFGVHLFQLIDTGAGAQISFDEARDRIREAMMRVKADGIVADYAESAMQEPDRIQVFLELERTLAALGGPDFRPGGP